MMTPETIPFAFFGTPDIAVAALDSLAAHGFVPALVVTAPDRPAGRGLGLAPAPVKTWARSRGIPILTPEKLDADFIAELKAKDYQLFIIAAYGKIIPKEVLDIPTRATLNIHPSLLPKYRGAAPVRGAILAGETETGVTVMLVDEQMDHGSVVAQKKFPMDAMRHEELERILFAAGGELLAELIPKWLNEEITSVPQDDGKASYTKKAVKEDGLIDLGADGSENWKKFRAYYGFPGSYFFAMRGGKTIRVKITDAAFENGAFVIKKVIPEGKKEMAYEAFLRGS